MRTTAIVSAVVIAALSTACGAASANTRSTGSSGTSREPTAPIDELVAISPTRDLHLVCQGTGSPTVVLISGGVNSGAIWSMPYDFDNPGPTVFPEISKTTRVCAYDRPNTASPAPNDQIALGTSTPVAGTVTPANGVVDLHRLLEAADVPGPYVLVAHSVGGLIARLYDSTYPDQVAGLVLIDSPSEYFFDRLTVPQQEMWVTANSGEPAFPGAESFNFPATFAEMRAAKEPPKVPTTMFTSDEPFDYSAAVAAGTLPQDYLDFGPLSFQAHVDGQRELAAKLGADLIEDTNSGHYVFVQQPELVTNSIRHIVDEVQGR